MRSEKSCTHGKNGTEWYFYYNLMTMAADDKKSQKNPSIVSVQAAKRLRTILRENIDATVRIGDVVHVYAPIRKNGSSRQKVVDKLTYQFEQLLLNGSEETLKNALAFLTSLENDTPASSSSLPTNFFVVRQSTDGTLVIQKRPSEPRPAKSIAMAGGGTGSTGPGSKPRGKK